MQLENSPQRNIQDLPKRDLRSFLSNFSSKTSTNATSVAPSGVPSKSRY